MDLKDRTTHPTPVTPQPVAPTTEYVQVRTARRKRRRMLGWAMFGLAGVAIGAVWAAGFATSQSTSDNAASTAPFIAATPNPQLESKFADVVSAETPLALSFTGTWGNVPFTTIFEVDFAANAETMTGTYFAEVLLTDPLPSGYTTLQLEFVIDNQDCDAVNVAGSWTQDAISIMPVETQDARAVFTGLAGGSKHCIGVREDTKADDPLAHYIRRPANGVVTPPNLFLNVSQSA
ncbi:MAG: hypothetical protein WEC34_10885 [Acidimicrobiia bacterium]